MNERGAPTGMYQAMPEHLKPERPGFDLATAEARLIVHRADLPEVTLPIERPEFLIGRAVEGVDLTLDDDLVSRQHAKLTVNERGYFRLEDLGSTNGVQYEGRRVKRLTLVDGDVFEIGDTRIEFRAKFKRFVETAARPKAPPRQDSVFADLDIPAPRAESVHGDENFGWDPEQARAQAQAAEAPEQPPAPEAEEPEEPEPVE